VQQVGVCILKSDVDSPDDQTYQLQYNRGQQSTDNLFSDNSQTTFDGVGIVTTPTTATPIDQLPYLNVQKYYCQQYSIVYNNSNMFTKYSTWDVDSIVSPYCDYSITSAFLSFSLQQETTLSSKQLDGTPIHTSLSGLPTTIEVFGASTPIPSNGSTDCDIDTDVETQHGCVNIQQTAMNDASVAAQTAGVDAINIMQDNQVDAAATSHLSSSGATDPSDPNYIYQVQEKAMLDNAASLPRETVPLTEKNIPTETTPTNTRFQTPVEDGDAQDQNPLFYDFSKSTARALNSKSMDDNNDSSEKPSRRGIIEQTRDHWIGVLREFQVTVDLLFSIREDVTFSHRRDLVFSERRARRGKHIMRKLLALREREYNEAHSKGIDWKSSEYMPQLRKLLGVPVDANSTIEDLGVITSALLGLGRSPNITEDHEQLLNEIGISEEDFLAFTAQEAFESIQYMIQQVSQYVLPHFYDLFYGLVDGADITDYAFFDGNTGASGPSGKAKCVNRMNKPYECCGVDNATPYDCCVGLWLCFRLLPASMFTEYTNKQTLHKWQCNKFNSFSKEWITSTRLIYQALVENVDRWTGTSLKESTFSSWIVFSDAAYPEKAGGCMWLYSDYLLLGVIIGFAVFLLLSSGLFIELFIFLDISSRNTTRDQKLDTMRKHVQQLQAEKIQKKK
jgi:hypothetical protein